MTSLRQLRLRQLKAGQRPSPLNNAHDIATGKKTPMLFQVVAIFSDYRFDQDEYNRLWDIHSKEGDFACDLPPVRHGLAEFGERNGYLFNGNPPQMCRQSPHILYSSSPYIQLPFDGHNHENPQLLIDTKSVSEQYIPLIEQKFPYLHFKDGAALCHVTSIGLEFKFALQPARQDLYDPSTLRQLQPLTVLGDDDPIMPKKTCFILPSNSANKHSTNNSLVSKP